MSGEDDYSQLGTAQMGFDLDQLPAVDMPFPSSGTPTFPLAGNMDNNSVGMSSTTVTSPLSASLPANFGHVTLSKLTRRTEEGGRVKPPPPYPTSPPQQKSSNNSALQELLSIRSPGRLPSPNATGSLSLSLRLDREKGDLNCNLVGGSHSPSPTAQRPTYSGGARQRTSNSGSSSSGGGQNIPKSPNLAATNPLLLARLSSSAPGPSILGGNAPPGESSAWQRREPRNRLFSTSSLVEEVHGSASSISTGTCNLRQVLRLFFRSPLTCPIFLLKLT